MHNVEEKTEPAKVEEEVIITDKSSKSNSDYKKHGVIHTSPTIMSKKSVNSTHQYMDWNEVKKTIHAQKDAILYGC